MPTVFSRQPPQHRRQKIRFRSETVWLFNSKRSIGTLTSRRCATSVKRLQTLPETYFPNQSVCTLGGSVTENFADHPVCRRISSTNFLAYPPARERGFATAFRLEENKPHFSGTRQTTIRRRNLCFRRGKRFYSAYPVISPPLSMRTGTRLGERTKHAFLWETHRKFTVQNKTIFASSRVATKARTFPYQRTVQKPEFIALGDLRVSTPASVIFFTESLTQSAGRNPMLPTGSCNLKFI